MNVPSETARLSTNDEILGLLKGEIEPVRNSPLYVAGLLLVTIVMVLLPLLYVALIGLVGYLTYLHATVDVGILNGSGFRIRLLMYLGPIVVGCVVCLFLVKPFFARPLKPPEPVSLDPSREPLLFAWVKRLCALVNAPVPARIDVDCEANASASFRRGFFSITGQDLVLTIGIPLVQGMSLVEFTGVLAHEFGHFAQGGGMRLSYIIRRVNHWFARVVYERDGLDRSLEASLQSTGGLLGIVVLVSQGCVWVSRQVLWVLMQIGHLISSFLLRQMEFDADRYEARVAGSDQFEHTVHRLHALMIGHNAALRPLGAHLAAKTLPDNIPAICLVKSQAIDKMEFQNYMARVLEQKTSRWSTHPSDRDRIENAKQEQAPGLLQTDLPAHVLITEPDALAIRASRAFYMAALDPKVSSDVHNIHFISSAEFLEAEDKESERNRGVLRYFQGLIDGNRLFFPSVDALPGDSTGEATVREIEETRAGLIEARGEDLDKRYAIIDRRLYLDLQLLSNESVSTTLLKNQLARDHVEGTLAILTCLRRIHPRLVQITRRFEHTMEILQEAHAHPSEERQEQIEGELNEIHADYMHIREELDRLPYPFSRPHREMTCADYVMPETPTAQEASQLLEATHYLLGMMPLLYEKSIARLVEIVEQAEDAIGLARLPIPDLPLADPPIGET